VTDSLSLPDPPADFRLAFFKEGAQIDFVGFLDILIEVD